MVVEVQPSARTPLAMAKPKGTPKRGKHNHSTPRNNNKPSSPAKQKVKAVDLVTGKTTVEYFYDPSLEIRQGTSQDASSSLSASSSSLSSFKTPMKSSNGTSGVNDAKFFNSKYLFMPCTIIKPLDEENAKGTTHVTGQPYAGPTLVKTTDGTLHKIVDSTRLIALHSPDDYLGCDDVLHLPQVTEASLLNALRIRYKRDDIYTSAGPILISVNPYKNVNVDGESLYSEDQMMVYRVKSGIDADLKPPHLFQIADRAYSALMESIHASSAASRVDDEDAVTMLENHVPPGSLRNQSILVSGESGAGKTEATKIIMKYLARITRKADRPESLMSPDGKMIAALEDRVLSSNPLLETFGNAQTLRNDNSSRFGKYTLIYFNMSSGSITGASISNYLLEKTRITKQVEGERNYHVFYQLLAGADASMLSELGLDVSRAASHYHYLGCRDAPEMSEHDVKSFEETLQCLQSIGLSSLQQKTVFSLVAAVLHLGNIQFEENGDEDNHHEGDHAKIKEESAPSVQKACELLGIDEAKLSEALLTKSLNVNGKTIKKRQNVVMAEDKRDALAKLTYSSLFLWLVKRVNETLNQTSTVVATPRKETHIEKGFIGVLDIYGFECFETNGYEQLLINYCNEKLQRHFNRHLFEVEQQIYVNEGVDWTYITFNDNRPCLELIEGGGGCVGILNTLDDAWGGMGSATEKDTKFVTHLHKLFGPVETKKDDDDANGGGHRNYIMPKFGNDRQFVIVHYAGEVRYTAEGFVEKNMDSMSNELRELGDTASLELPKQVFECAAGSSSTRSTIRGVSVGSQFRTSLQSLVSDLEKTQPHYVRCIKPNLTKAPSKFLAGEVLKQLRYSGMMEAIRIRREGYAFREDHESFYHRFNVLLSGNDSDNGEESGIVQLVNVLSKRLHVSNADWQIGHSKIFLRRELAEKLERLARLRVHVAARALGRFGRRAAQKRAARFLVPWFRFRVHMLRQNRKTRAATKIASMVRRFKTQQVFLCVRSGVIRLQAEQRRKLAVLHANKMRDPYYYVSFRECQELLATEQGRLEKAVKKKNFRLAADLEAKIALVEAAIERKRPLTRSVLESRILDVQKELESAVSRKAYAECGPLQEKLDELIAKRTELPTIEELRQAVRSLEDEVAQAAKDKDYVAAAKGQSRLEEARSRLADVLAADGTNVEQADEKENLFGFESRAQLEREISDLVVQIKKAVEMRNFTKASSLQHVLDERERLRKLFPSVEELQAELSEAMRKLDEAVSRKDFSAAGQLNDDIAKLELKLEAEKANAPEPVVEVVTKVSMVSFNGEELEFLTRGDLESSISDVSALIKKSVGKRDFKLAASYQSDFDRMVELRALLPSLVELQHRLQDRKHEMSAAIAAKNFSKADELNSLIEDLSSRVELEKSATKLHLSGDDARATAEVTSIKTTPITPRSTRSIGTLPSARSAPPATPGLPAEVRSENTKSVRKLRPAPPVISVASDSIGFVAKTLSKKRASSSIIVDPTTGELVGIVTTTDFTRRVVSRGVNTSATAIAAVMTPNPTCVSMSDPAVEALTTMVENHFRHLPVIEDDGSLAGVLDISKCLTEAISKLEAAQEVQTTSSADDVVKKVANQQILDGTNAAALQALLSALMSQSSGGGKPAPTLRSLLHEKPTTVVRPDQTIREASVLMAEHRRAALVVDVSGELLGVFGFKDMMSRAIAKEVDVNSTAVAEVMTADPVTVLPDANVIEALHMMVDHRVLTLPVCEKNGSVVGLVDVMDVIYGCGGADGWRSVFSSAMDLDDDVSDVTSVHSATSGKRPVATATDALLLSAVKESVEERPVSKLRPSKPIVTTSDDTLLRTAKLLSSKRSAAALIVDTAGSLAGILTDKDVTCRVVAKSVDPSNTFVSEVMTPNPMCVSVNDAAMDALTLMVENRFRHLPVIDDHGAVVGTLDIVKCLTSIIGKLEKVEKIGEKTTKDMVKQVIDQQGASGVQAAALQALLGNLLTQATGGKAIPTLRSLLHGKPSTAVSPTTSLRKTGLVMAEHRHGALVVNESGQLVGIFTFKDMMTRAVAEELDLDSVPVSEVMTSHPETVVPEMTVLEALQIMADNKFLTLPVCEANGQVLGVVDALDVIYGCGGSDGWRSVFSRAMEVSDDGNTVVSGQTKSVTSGGTGPSKSKKIAEKTVSKLRPTKPVLSFSTESIVSIAQLLQRKRSDSSLIVTPDGDLAGILTDTDFTRRAVARNLDPETTPVSAIMTPEPTCVALSDSAMDALSTMVENHFRHLPVVDDEGAVVGILDISKCLNDAIERLELRGSQGESRSTNISLDNAFKQVANLHGASQAQTAALQQLLGTLMSQAVGGKSLPTLRSLLQQRPSTIVGPTSTVREAGLLMAESRKAALVVDSGRLVGIFGFKDMMNRCIAERLDLDKAPISEVMTPDPESVLPDITVLDALYTMYDHKFLTLPVCESNGKVVGLVDVMDVIYGCGGSEGWRSIFSSAMDLYDDEDESKSVAVSIASKGSKISPMNKALPSGIPANLEFDKMQSSLVSQRLLGDGEDGSGTIDMENPVFKVTDPSGKTYKIKSDGRFSTLVEAVASKTLIPRSGLQLQYTDDVDDVVTMTCDDDVVEAWNLAKKSGMKIAKLSAITCETKAKAVKDQQVMIAAGVAVAAVLGGLALIILRPKPAA